MRKTAFMGSSARSRAETGGEGWGLRVMEIEPGLAVLTVVLSSKRAKKRQVQEMVCTLLKAGEVTRHDAAADGRTIAVCHVFSSQASRATSMASRC